MYKWVVIISADDWVFPYGDTYHEISANTKEDAKIKALDKSGNKSDKWLHIEIFGPYKDA